MAMTRSISRAAVPITSFSGLNCSGISQGGKLLLSRSKQPHLILIGEQISNTSSYTRATLVRPNFSLQKTFLLNTSQSRNWNGEALSINNSKLLMMAVAIPKMSYSTAVSKMQPDTDALDESVDPIQRQLLAEQCIVLNNQDEVIGHDTKRNCHRIVNQDVLLHRAFSVFLFNGKGELLLQQRSKTKITFPHMWTNTCCSHPLYEASELEEKEALGVKRAARRRLEIELGIPQDSISLDDFNYLTRIHYKALSNSIWGEHEIDYILFLQKDDLEINPNPDEIQDIRWVTLGNVKEMIVKENVSLTPWFELILNSRLPVWWKNLKDLKQFQDHKTIHRM
ncbi:unnamed protein product [Orchesella dallaii]|uniref:isopentenyl-diphosphate Delta-isomerase n=1 Tax=Orchesella dallaii TaxID=48710 RepID=A0ABP1QNZ5_9HEXA